VDNLWKLLDMKQRNPEWLENRRVCLKKNLDTELMTGDVIIATKFQLIK
jgi:hypothetical protein